MGIKSLNGNTVQPFQLLRPRLRIVPMGWSWALWWCQNVHENIVSAAGAINELRPSDQSPAPNSKCCHTEYVDNFHVLGTSREQVLNLSASGAKALRDHGLIAHEEEFEEATAKKMVCTLNTQESEAL